MQEQRALLDQLFGKDRDLPSWEKEKVERKFSDADVCKYALCGLCPFKLFTNTRSDLGPCSYDDHDEKWKEEFDKLSDREKERYGYERELMRKLQDLVRDMNRKIEKNKARASEENAPRPLNSDQEAQLAALSAQSKAALEASEKLGEEGKVEASMKAAADAVRLKEERDKLEKQFTTPLRIMFVCEICGVFINSTDNEARMADHYNGKQYLGWKAVRDKLKELEDKYAGRAPEPMYGGRDGGRDGGYRGRERESYRERSRSRERERGRDDREGDRRRDDRGGDRDRDRGRRY